MVQSVIAAIIGLIAVIALPHVAELYQIINATVYISMAIFALSLALVWGYGGILCFGQAAFFGLGSYAYAVAAINFGDTTYAVLPAILVPALFAGVLGYFLFYGRLNDVYLGVITLTVTLILFKLINSTGGNFHIGKARLGGFNGLPETPGLNWFLDPGRLVTSEGLYMIAAGSLTALYILCKLGLGTTYGRLIVAVRENETRAELLGYDSRFLKLTIFMIGAGIAGWAGLLFANCVFVSPTVFGLASTAQVLIWVVVGGLGTLIGPVIGCILLQMIAGFLGTLGWIDPNIVLGMILIIFVLFIRDGLLPTLARLGQSFLARPSGTAEETLNGN